ncbi:acetyl-CoA synthetase-like protein [Aureobasidium sp. EXF-8845]|nr:acetyl-CoA synthetase-like protein [Aureobasidium sp. EXF-8845]KAI4858040.1 acetyl-CoA synthetase-like protein [Aureobasidium sp. EXF-8846]
MPITSSYPSIICPDTNLWDFVFCNADRGFPDEHVIYVDAVSKAHCVRILLMEELETKSGLQHFSKLRISSEHAARPQIDPEEDMAFLVYSSGTTGLPKGVMLTHRNVMVNMLQNAVGIQTHIMQRFDLQDFCKIFQDEKITTAYIVPPVALALAKSPVVDGYDIKSLRSLTSAAAPAPRDVIREIHRRFGLPTRQVYGLSEAAPGVTSQAMLDWDKPIGSSGRLAPNMSLKVMHAGREMECGKEGELWIRGPNIFKGYYNNSTATAAALNAEGWYRTGDIGYFDKDHNIFITDRLKELIKYNGFQVPPAQLESLLIGHPAVLDVAVIEVYDEEKATELPRAYVVVAYGYRADETMQKDLHGWLNKQVVSYKRLRGGIRFVEAIPKSAAGKILRRVLVEQAKKEQAATRARS